MASRVVERDRQRRDGRAATTVGADPRLAVGACRRGVRGGGSTRGRVPGARRSRAAPRSAAGGAAALVGQKALSGRAAGRTATSVRRSLPTSRRQLAAFGLTDSVVALDELACGGRSRGPPSLVTVAVVAGEAGAVERVGCGHASLARPELLRLGVPRQEAVRRRAGAARRRTRPPRLGSSPEVVDEDRPVLAPARTRR